MTSNILIVHIKWDDRPETYCYADTAVTHAHLLEIKQAILGEDKPENHSHSNHFLIREMVNGFWSRRKRITGIEIKTLLI